MRVYTKLFGAGLASILLVATVSSTTIASQTGTASYVDESFGSSYLALPSAPRGTIVRIDGPAGSVARRRSTDVGPVPSLHRIADLSYADFGTVCGSHGKGTCTVTITFLDESSLKPRVTLPPTDTE